MTFRFNANDGNYKDQGSARLLTVLFYVMFTSVWSIDCTVGASLLTHGSPPFSACLKI